MTIQQASYDPALAQGAANTVALPQTITAATSSALAVGANGATNPVIQVDTSTSSVATGLKVTGAATGTPVALAAIGSGTNESITISPKAAGTVKINGQIYPTVSGSGATVTLTKDQFGAVVLMDRAAGIVFTLPANTPGASITFAVTTSVTSNAYKVITAAGTELLVGGVMSDDTDSSDAVAYFPSVVASSNIAVSMNGSTTGGLIGTWMTFTCLNSTKWLVSGVVAGSGSVATPFSAS